MSTTFTTNTGMGVPAAADRNWQAPLIADLNYLDAQAALGACGVQVTEVPSATLNVKVAPAGYLQQDGTIGSYAGSSSHAMTASSTNYLYLDLTASGALTVDTTGFPTTAHVRVAVVVAGSGAITSITDARVAYTVLGTFLDGVNLSFGTTTGTQIGTASGQKIGFFGATPVVQQAMGTATAGSSYTTTEQGMLQAVYDAVRALGLGS